MENWSNLNFWFVYMDQTIAFVAIVFFVDMKRLKSSFALLAAINFAPALSLLFATHLANLYVGLLMLISCSFAFWLMFAVFFSRLDNDYKTGIKVLSITPIFNSLAAFFLTGAIKNSGWRICVALGLVSCVFCLFSCLTYRRKNFEG
jgi:hypothetical protein